MKYSRWHELSTSAPISMFLLGWVFFSFTVGCGVQQSDGTGGRGVDDVADAPPDTIYDTLPRDFDQLIAPGSNATACTSGKQCPTGYSSPPQWPQPNGTPCMSKTQCASHHCVDDYCCDTACTGLCQACSTAKKGSGDNGICDLIASATDPDNECILGECNGSGACNQPQFCTDTVILTSEPPSPYPTNGQTGARAIKLADFNTDGHLDVALANYPYLTIMLNQGNGALGSPMDLQGAYYGIATADFNGDGKPDIATPTTLIQGSSYGGVRVWLNQGNGTFGPYVDYPIEGCDEHAILTADFSSDGKPDIAVMCYKYNAPPNIPSQTNVSVLLNLGDGTFMLKWSTYYYGGFIGGSSSNDDRLAAADINGDGSNDLLIAMAAHYRVYVWLNYGGTFVQGTPYGFSVPHSVVTGDLNGDALADAVISDGETARVMLNLGNGIMAKAVNYPIINGSRVTLVDLNGDGLLDFVIPWSPTSLVVRFNQGAGVLGSPFEYTTGAIGGWGNIAAGDMNNDGRADVVLAGSYVTVLLNHCLL